MKKKLEKAFYLRPTVEVARDLLGKFLVSQQGDQIIAAPIIETEAYAGFDDKACHGSKNKTERNKVMFNSGGFAYVYIIYGIHHCLNLVTEHEDFPSAVLIRALDYPNANGPGKLCREFGITKQTHNGLDLTADVLWVEDRGGRLSEILSSPRIGVDYAGECAAWPWRFYF